MTVQTEGGRGVRGNMKYGRYEKHSSSDKRTVLENAAEVGIGIACPFDNPWKPMQK
jgi:hypothetical protein